MSGFFSKLFGSKKKTEAVTSLSLVEDTMKGLIEKAQFDLTFTVRATGEKDREDITVELDGPDQELLTEKDGAVLDAFQLFLKRVIQHHLPEARVNVSFDCNGFREESQKSLIELAERLRDKALEQNRSVYVRALPPKDRKVVHQFLAGDDRVKSRSVGDGLFKKIKIYPVRQNQRAESDESHSDEVTETSNV